MISPGLIDLVHRLEDIFERLQVERSYGGAIAYNYYAPPRFTQDIDLLVLVPAIQMPALVEDLSLIGCTENIQHPGSALELETILRSLRSKPYLSVIYCGGIRVELFAPWHPFHHGVIKRSPLRQLEGRSIRIHMAEDLTIFKMIFHRAKDLGDIKAMLLTQQDQLDLVS